MNRFPGIVITLFSVALLTACSGGGGSASGLSPTPDAGNGGVNPGPSGSPQSGTPTIQLASSSMKLPFGFNSSGYDSNKLKEFVQVSDNELQLSTTITIGSLTTSFIPSDKPGTYSVLYKVTNAEGEVETATLQITVEPPVIELLGDAQMFLQPGTTEKFSDPGARIGSLMATIEGEVPPALLASPPYAVGSYEIPYSYTYQTALGEEVELTALRTVQVTPVVADLKVLTRVNGVSPETVYFSAADSRPVDPADCVDFSGARGDQSEEALIACSNGQYFGYHFYFDDPDSGNFSFPDLPVTALLDPRYAERMSKNHQSGASPRAIHTFVCEGAGNRRWDAQSQSCKYRVRVRVQDPQNRYADAWIDVHIKPQSVAYSGQNTYCIAHDGNFSGCPANVPSSNHLQNSPRIGNFSGKRVLYKRRSSTADSVIYDDVCIGYDESHVRIDAFGSGPYDPVIGQVMVGVGSGCDSHGATTAEAQSYPRLSKDENGHITQGWAFDVSVANLRLGSIGSGMASTLFTMHNLDLDWSNSFQFRPQVNIVSSGHFCLNSSSLDCSVVQYPYGIFVSEVRVIGNINNPPPTLLACYNSCGIVNGGIIGSQVKTTSGHGARFMGAWGLVVAKTWFRGNNIHPSAPKARLTLRQMDSSTLSSQTINPEDFENGGGAQGRPGYIRGEVPSEQFTPHYNFIVDSWFNDVIMEPSDNSAGMLDIWPGNRFSGSSGAWFFTYPGQDTNPTQLSIGGKNIFALDTTFNGHSVDCRYRSSSTGSYYHEESKLWAAGASSGGCQTTSGLTIPLIPSLSDVLSLLE